MVTLLKAFLMGVDDPFELTKVFMDEIKKDVQAYEERQLKIKGYDIEDFNKEIKEFDEYVETLNEAIYDEEEDIKSRNQDLKEKVRQSNPAQVAREDLAILNGPNNEERRKLIRSLIDQRVIASDDKESSLYVSLIRNLEGDAKKPDKGMTDEEKEKLQSVVDDLNKKSNVNLKRYKKALADSQQEKQYYDKEYKVVVGFDRGKFDGLDDEKKVEILTESLEELNDQIKAKEDEILPDSKQSMNKEIQEEIRRQKIKTEPAKEAVRQGYLTKYKNRRAVNNTINGQLRSMRYRYSITEGDLNNLTEVRTRQTKTPKTERRQKMAWLLVGATVDEYEDALNEYVKQRAKFPKEPLFGTFLIIPENYLAQKLDYANPFRDTPVELGQDINYARDAKGQLYRWNPKIRGKDGGVGDFEKTKEFSEKYSAESKKLFLLGGFGSWQATFSEASDRKRVQGLNDMLERRGLSKVKLTQEIKDAIENESVSLLEFKNLVKEKNPQILQAMSFKTEDGLNVNSWADWQSYQYALSNTLRDKDEGDKDGQMILDALRTFFEGLSEDELEIIRTQASGLTTSPQDAFNAKGNMKRPKERVPALRDLSKLLTSLDKDLDLSSDKKVAIKAIQDRIKIHIEKALAKKNKKGDVVEEEELDIDTITNEMEFLYDLYEDALDIREELPDDTTREYRKEEITNLLNKINELFEQLETDPKGEDLTNLYVNFDALVRNIDDVEIPSWVPIKKKIQGKIKGLENKLDKVWKDLEKKEIDEIKEAIGEGMQTSKLNRFGRSTYTWEAKRNKTLKLYIDAAIRTRNEFLIKLINDGKKGIEKYKPKEAKKRIESLVDIIFPHFRYVAKVDQNKYQTQVIRIRDELVAKIKEGKDINKKDYQFLTSPNIHIVTQKKGEKMGQIPIDYKEEDDSPTSFKDLMEREMAESENVVDAVERVTQNVVEDKVQDDDVEENFEQMAAEESERSQRIEEIAREKGIDISEITEEMLTETVEEVLEEKEKKEGKDKRRIKFPSRRTRDIEREEDEEVENIIEDIASEDGDRKVITTEDILAFQRDLDKN